MRKMIQKRIKPNCNSNHLYDLSVFYHRRRCRMRRTLYLQKINGFLSDFFLFFFFHIIEGSNTKTFSFKDNLLALLPFLCAKPLEFYCLLCLIWYWCYCCTYRTRAVNKVNKILSMSIYSIIRFCSCLLLHTVTESGHMI